MFIRIACRRVVGLIHCCVTHEIPSSIQEQLLRRNVKRFRGGLVSKARRLLYHSTEGLGVIKEKEKKKNLPPARTRRGYETVT